MPDIPIVSGIVSPMQGQYPVTNTPQANAEAEAGQRNAPYAAMPIFYSSYSPPANRAQIKRPLAVIPSSPPVGSVQVRRVPISTETPSVSKKVYNGATKKPKRRIARPSKQRAFSLFGW